GNSGPRGVGAGPGRQVRVRSSRPESTDAPPAEEWGPAQQAIAGATKKPLPGWATLCREVRRGAYRVAAPAGRGAIRAPSYAVQQALADGQLVTLLDEWHTQTIPVHMICAPRRYLSAKVRVFIDWVVSLFERTGSLRRERPGPARSSSA